MRACTPGLRTCLPTYALLPSTLLLPTLFTGERMMLVLGLGQGCGGPSETQVRKTILLTGGIPFPHLCCVLVALLPLNVSVPGGRGEVSPHAPEPDQKPWLLLPPLYDADAKMYQTNHDNKEKTLYSSSQSVCPLLSVSTARAT